MSKTTEEKIKIKYIDINIFYMHIILLTFYTTYDRHKPISGTVSKLKRKGSK